MSAPADPAVRSPARPGPARRSSFWLSLAMAFFLLLSLAGWVRMTQAVLHWNLQVELLGRPMAIYLVASGALWGLVGLLAAWFQARRSPIGLLAASLAGIFYPLAFWLEWLLLVRSPEDRVSWPFLLVMTLLWLLLVGWAAWRPLVRRYLLKRGVNHERTGTGS